MKPLPCPFCGSEKTVLIWNEDQDLHHVQCDGCSAKGPESFMVEEDAIEYWNRRSTPSSPKPLDH
jgi:Lar family restriction alleviation protein